MIKDDYINNFEFEMKEKYGENLLYIGLRGSRVLGLNNENSDYDFTVVLKETKDDIQRDCAFYGYKTFMDSFYRAEIDVVEAVLNPVFIDNMFRGEHSLLYSRSQHKIFKETVIINYFLSIKNLYKRFLQDTQNTKYLQKANVFYLCFLDWMMDTKKFDIYNLKISLEKEHSFQFLLNERSNLKSILKQRRFNNLELFKKIYGV